MVGRDHQRSERQHHHGEHQEHQRQRTAAAITYAGEPTFHIFPANLLL